MDRESLLILGDWILLAGVIPATYFVLDYGLRRPFLGFVPWWRSAIGWMFMVLAFAFITTDIAVLMSLWLGPDYPGREIVRILAYGFSTIASIALTAVYIREKILRGPRVVLHHERDPEAEPYQPSK